MVNAVRSFLLTCGTCNEKKMVAAAMPAMPKESAAASCVILDITWVSEADHDCGGKTNRPRHKANVVRWESHDQDQLNQEEGDSQEPVNITVGVLSAATVNASVHELKIRT